MKISNKNVSRSTDKTPARNNGTNNYKSTIVTTNKQTNKTNVGNSNMKYNSVASRTKTQNRYASQDNRKETRLPIETNLKTNSLVLNKNLDNSLISGTKYNQHRYGSVDNKANNRSPIKTSLKTNSVVLDKRVVSPLPKMDNKKLNTSNISSISYNKQEEPRNTNRKNNSMNHTSNSGGISRLNSLYKKGKEKEEKLKKQGKEAEDKRKANELEACTFKPKINNNFNPVQKTILNARQIPMYERQQMWNNKKIEKYFLL
jgi:hypothetical protein